jgi:hypothetical protein
LFNVIDKQCLIGKNCNSILFVSSKLIKMSSRKLDNQENR